MKVRIVNEDGSDDIAVLSAQVVDRQTGAVVALNDLSVGRYDVTVMLDQATQHDVMQRFLY